jgi:hypothetical protein
MQLHAGVAAYTATRLCEEPETASIVASLLADPRWPWRPWSVWFGLRERWGKYSRGRVLEYIRHPRWGTYLHRSHLERVGGLDRVRELARPARIVELGDLVFLQRVTDADRADKLHA